jgi:hypothetical protein
MSFRITLSKPSPGWQACITCVDDPAWVPLVRPIGRGDAGYPRPPTTEPDWWDATVPGLYTGTEDTTVQQVHNRCVRGAPDWGRREVVSFGRYLFATLFGSDWAAITGKAANQPIELELDLTAAGSLFERLPWEMMFAANEPLAALQVSGARVAVSRIVKVDPPLATAPIEIPLRVLFVIGRQMDDAIRPGAEYFCLLRQFEFQITGAQGQSFGIALHTKLLLSATRQDVIDAMNNFAPEVVHLISHGRRNGPDTELLLTKDVNGAATEDPVKPDALATILKTKRGVQAVVLNACNTGDPTDAHVSYAAQLVKNGIRVVVGMAGEVADSVCRLFTSRFYAALYEGLSVPLAVAEGRRAALLQYQTYTQNVEWARPVLYVADQTATTFIVDRTRQNVAIAAKVLRKRTDILCDRMDYLHAMERVCERRIANLALAVQEPKEIRGALPVQLGKTWLLEEMRWLAVLEGYVPCLVESVHEEEDPPRNYLLFAWELIKAMNATREAWDGKRKLRTSTLKAMFRELKRVVPDGDGQIGYESDEIVATLKERAATTTSAETVKDAILNDLTDFLEEAKAVLGVRGILVLVDDLHRYDGVWKTILAGVGVHGFGDRDTPAPLVFSYAAGDGTGLQIGAHVADNSSTIVMQPLTRFRQEERRMAYRQKLLSRKFTPTAKADLKQQVENVFVRFETLTQGIPSYLMLDKLWTKLEVSIEDGVLVTSDDSDIISKVRQFDGN